SPSSGLAEPLMTLARVDLPEPFSPVSACTSPARIAKSTWFSATTPGNVLVAPRTSTSGALFSSPTEFNFPFDPFPRGGVHFGSILDWAPHCGVECLKLFGRWYKIRRPILLQWNRFAEDDSVPLVNVGAGCGVER